MDKYYNNIKLIMVFYNFVINRKIINKLRDYF